MNIYFFDRQSHYEGPFDIIDSKHEHLINVGDVCLCKTIHGIAFLFVYSTENSWSSCLNVGIGCYDNLNSIKESLLFSFDGIHSRKGNVGVLKMLLPCFKERAIVNFFVNAIDILEFKKDAWDVEIFQQFFASNKELICQEEKRELIIETKPNNDRQKSSGVVVKEVTTINDSSFLLKPSSKKETRNLFRQYRNGNQKAFDKLVKENLYIVHRIAHFYRNNGVDYEDLVQEGTIGLIRAIERFNLNRKVPFSLYAKWWIIQAILGSIKTLPYTVKLPSSQMTLYFKVRKNIERYEQEHGYEPSASEIDIEEDVDPEVLAYISSLPDDLNKLVSRMDNWEDYPSSEFLADDTLMKESRTHFINAIIGKLKKRDADILRRAFGIGVKEETLEEIGDRMFLTRERVRQIKESAIRKLRDILELKKEEKKEETAPPQLRIIKRDTVEQKEEKKNNTPSVPQKIKRKEEKKKNILSVSKIIKPRMSWERATFLDKMRALSKESETYSPKYSKKQKEQTHTDEDVSPEPSLEEIKIEKSSKIKEIEKEAEVGNVIEYDSKKCTVIEKKEGRLIIKFDNETIDNVIDDKDRYEVIYKALPKVKAEENEVEISLVTTREDEKETNVGVDFSKIERVFDKKASSYKYFWFMSIISLAKERGDIKLPYKDILIRMATLAWPIVMSDGIDLGENDMIAKYLNEIQRKSYLINNASIVVVESYLRDNYAAKDIGKILSPLLKNVPYRFLSPWIKYSTDEEVIRQSLEKSSHGFYALHDDFIIINKVWWDYIKEHYDDVCNFALQSFISYVKQNNKSVKLLKLKTLGWLGKR